MPEIPTPGDSFDFSEEKDPHLEIQTGQGEGAAPESDQPFFMEALRSKHPNPSLSEVEQWDDVADNWREYGMRGLQKAMGVDDAEAWIDLMKAGIGAVMAQQEQQESENSEGGSTPAEGLKQLEGEL